MIEIIHFIENQLLLSSLFLFLLALLIFNIISAKLRKYQDIDVHELVSLMNNKKLILLDVREQKERVAGHIENDIHISMGKVKSKLASLNKDYPILVYCRSGNRSARIAQMLGKYEFKPYNLKGGFIAWNKANMPISKK